MDNVLILQAARFGDLVQTRRLILTLAQIYQTHLLVDNKLADLAQILYPETIIHSVSFHGQLEASFLNENLSVFAELKKISFYKIYNCNFSHLTAAICRLFPEEKIITYRPSHNSTGGILRSDWARLIFRVSRFRAATPLNLVDFWANMEPFPIHPNLVNPPAKPGGEGIGIVVSGRESRRSLSASTLAKIIETVYRYYNGPKIKLFGTKQDFRLSAKLLRLLPAEIQIRVLNLCGKTSYAELIRNIQGLDLLLSPDTGTMHLAAYLGVPVMAFFLSSAWCHETGPYGSGHIIWQGIAKCSPCLESSSCPHEMECDRSINDPGFGRFIIAALNKNQKILDQVPSCLQCWQTGLDEFGLKLNLVAGIDNQKQNRDILRTLLGRYLKLPSFSFERFPADQVNLFIAQLLPDEEWMVPKELYY